MRPRVRNLTQSCFLEIKIAADKRVIIVGGFTGINAKKLGKKEVVHLDRQKKSLLVPAAHISGNGTLNPAEIALLSDYPKQYKNVDVKLSKVIGIINQIKVVKLEDVELGYDYLVLACGSTTILANEWEKFCTGIENSISIN